MALLQFFAGEGFNIDNLNGSGLGFFGSAGFGASVPVGEYQGTTFITNSTGTVQSSQVDNVKYANAASGIVGSSSSGIALTAIPNYQSTLNIRFTHGTAVQTQNVKLRIYDRDSVNNDPSGVTCKVAEVIHPNTTQINDGSGSTTWYTPTGSSVIMDLVSSPGTSGLSPNGPSTTDTQHDHYICLSASPDSVGSKLFALYCELEYL